MKEKAKEYIPISAFATHTRFGIVHAETRVVESGSPGCIEVHIASMKGGVPEAMPGGRGLVLAGSVPSINDRARLWNKLALVSGFPEVFEVCQHFDEVVVLRPLGIGLGINWKLFRDHQESRPDIRRRSERHRRQLAKKHLQRAISSVNRLTGVFAPEELRESGPFYIEERTRGWHKRTPIAACTVEEAKIVARVWVSKMREEGWHCGEESSVRGTIQRESERTVAWLGLRGEEKQWLTIECGSLLQG